MGKTEKCEEHSYLLANEVIVSTNAARNSLPQASFNFINTITGSGCIGMAYVLYQGGILLGLAILVALAFLTDYSLIILVKCLDYTDGSSYSAVMQAAFGKPGHFLLSLLQFLYPLISMVGYSVIIGDTLTKVLRYYVTEDEETIWLRRDVIVFAASLLVSLPLIIFKGMAKLYKISLLSLVFTMVILVIIAVRAFTLGPSIPATEDAWKLANSGAVEAIAICSSAFICHHSSFLLYASLRQPSEEKWRQLTHVSVLISSVIQLVYACVGYVTFTGFVQGDLLENYCNGDHLINAARILFCLTNLFTYPIDCLVATDVVLRVLSRDYSHEDESSSTNKKRLLVTLALVCLTFLISCSTDCLSVVLQFNGVLAAIPLAYILPTACYLRLEPSPVFSVKKIPALFLAIFASSTTVSALCLKFIYWEDSVSCSHGSEMIYCAEPYIETNSTAAS